MMWTSEKNHKKKLLLPQLQRYTSQVYYHLYTTRWCLSTINEYGACACFHTPLSERHSCITRFIVLVNSVFSSELYEKNWSIGWLSRPGKHIWILDDVIFTKYCIIIQKMAFNGQGVFTARSDIIHLCSIDSCVPIKSARKWNWYYRRKLLLFLWVKSDLVQDTLHWKWNLTR